MSNLLVEKRYPDSSFIHREPAILREEQPMSTSRNRSRKHFRLDPLKIKRAQRILRTATETETIERALDFVISEYETNHLVNDANERFVKNGIDIKDVYGVLES